MTLATDVPSQEFSSLPERTDTEQRAENKQTVIIVPGKFESLHLGHRALANRAALLAATTHLASTPDKQKDRTPAPRIILLNFSSMRETLKLAPVLPLASSLQTESILRSWTIPNLSLKTLPFPLIRSLSPEEFISLLEEQFGATGIVCGADWRFGYKASGDVDTLREICGVRRLAVDVMPDVGVGNEVDGRVSTTLVRQKLAEGQVELVEKMLGRRYRADGYVAELDAEAGKIRCGPWLTALPGRGLYEASIRVRVPGPPGSSFRAQVDVLTEDEAEISAEPETIRQFEGLENLEITIEFIEREFHF